MTLICVGQQTIIGSDNGLSPERRQAIIWTNAGILLIGPLGTNFSAILIEIQTFSLKKIRLKMLSAKRCSFRLGLNVLMACGALFLKRICFCQSEVWRTDQPAYCQITILTSSLTPHELLLGSVNRNLAKCPQPYENDWNINCGDKWKLCYQCSVPEACIKGWASNHISLVLLNVITSPCPLYLILEQYFSQPNIQQSDI